LIKSLTISISPSLISLSITENSIGDATCMALSAMFSSPHSKLQSLNLASNSLDKGKGWESMMNEIGKNRELTDLDVSDNPLSDLAIISMADAFQVDCFLLHLKLEDIQATSASIKLLLDALTKHSRIQTLSLANNPLSADAGKSLAELIQKNSLIKLNLHSCSLGVLGTFEIICESFFKNASLKELILSNNQLHNDGISFFTTSLLKCHDSLRFESLNFSENKISFTACKSLIEAAKAKLGSSLQKLILSGNVSSNLEVTQLLGLGHFVNAMYIFAPFGQ